MQSETLLQTQTLNSQIESLMHASPIVCSRFHVSLAGTFSSTPHPYSVPNFPPVKFFLRHFSRIVGRKDVICTPSVQPLSHSLTDNGTDGIGTSSPRRVFRP